MKPVTEPEQADVLSSFIENDVPALATIDRSTLERYATCPAQARIVASGVLNRGSRLAEAGEQVHLAFGAMIADYMARGGFVNPGELADECWLQLRGSRPDVQPEAIRGGRASVWAFAKYIQALHPENILRYDGGHGERSGMLAHDMPELGIRLVSELDLLHATASPEVLAEIDYKSGWKLHSAESVSDSFQFQLHAFLVLNNYPDVACLRVRVWNTRSNTQTYAVDFRRDRLAEISTRIRNAAGEWFRWRDAPVESVPTWPLVDKCRICDAASRCPASGHAADVAKDPQGFLVQMVAVSAKLDAMHDLATAWADANGEIVAGNMRFGRNKPSSEKRKPAQLYSLKGEPDGE